MRELRPVLLLIDARVGRQLLVGLVLGCLAFGSTVSLLGLAGWFITVSALSGLLGALTFSLFLASGGVRAFALSRVLTRYAERVATHRATFTWLARLRVHFFERALRLPALDIAVFRQGDLLGRVLADVDALDQLPLGVLLPTASTVVVVLVGLAYLGVQAPAVAPGIALLAALASIGLPKLASTLGRKPGVMAADARSQLRTELIDALEGGREIAAYDAQRLVVSDLTRVAAEVDRGQAKLDQVSASSAVVVVAVSGVALLFALSVGLPQIAAGALDAPMLAVVGLVVLGLFDGLEGLPLVYQQLGLIRRAAERLNAVFLTPAHDHVEAELHPAAPDDAELRLTDVSFGYSGRSQPVLQGVSLVAPRGALVALSGPSGAGKSTLLRLCARQLEPVAGQLTLGRVPLHATDANAFCQHVGYVAQDSHVFSGTLRDNLLLAAPDAAETDVWSVLDIVGLTDLVRGLRDGLDTPVGEQGDHLSGGERRRLCVARAILRRPALLLLDEPTTGVDGPTAERMLRSLRTYLPSTTIVVASHDPLPLDADIALSLVQTTTPGSIDDRE
jgi:ATP-binding cassette, subfamily C, bacterial CydC